MDRSVVYDEGLIDEAVAIPARLFIMRFWQRDGFPNETPQRIRLWQRLTIELVNPLLWTVSRDDDQGNVLIICLSNSRCQIQQCRAAGDTDGNRFA